MISLEHMTFHPLDGARLVRDAVISGEALNIAVMTGAGEEGDTLAKVVLSRFLHANGKVWMWDHSGEFRAFCEKSEGKIIAADQLSLNPFAHVRNMTLSASSLCQWMLSLAGADVPDRYTLTHALSDALFRVWRKRQQATRLDDVVTVLEWQHPHSPTIRKLSAALRRYTTGGEFAAFFRGNTPSLSDENGLLLFSFDRMEVFNPELYQALSLTLLMEASLDMQRSHASRDVVCALEADVLDKSFTNPDAVAFFGRVMRTARKTGGAWLVHGHRWPDCQPVNDVLASASHQIIYLTSPVADRYVTGSQGEGDERLFLCKTARQGETLHYLTLSDVEIGQCVDCPDDADNLMELCEIGLTQQGALQFLGVYRYLGGSLK